MSVQVSTINQNLVKTHHSTIHVTTVHESGLSAKVIRDFLAQCTDNDLGLTAVYGTQCRITALVLANTYAVLVIKFATTKATTAKKRRDKKQGTPPGRALLSNLVLCNRHFRKFAFSADKLAVALDFDLKLYTAQLFELQSSEITRNGRHPILLINESFGGGSNVHQEIIRLIFRGDVNDKNADNHAALRAWICRRVGILGGLNKAQEAFQTINTRSIPSENLEIIATLHRNADRLDALKPSIVKNDVNTDFTSKKGNLELGCTRFKTRLRRSATQALRIDMELGGRKMSSGGRVHEVRGRSAVVSVQGDRGSKIISVYTIGKEELTKAEYERAEVVSYMLHQSTDFFTNPFVKILWGLNSSLKWPKLSQRQAQIPICFSVKPLNPSQRKAVQTILSNKDRDRITIIQGPPGTGKTTVISASVLSLMTSEDDTCTVWLIAHSNVAVKNIAEKLAEVDYWAFKLLVSYDFHFDWHEDLYTRICENVVRSDQFPEDIVGAETLLRGARVILSTISMLSNERLEDLIRLVPVKTVIVDEASQIEIGDYVPLLQNFRPTLQKLVFIGDDKQLAPYGQEELRDLKSIFEVPQLRKHAVFLDTQYRMPHPIGNFISRHVYGGRLKTVHAISTKSSCRLVNVSKGNEQKTGKSWTNAEECRAVVHIARKCAVQGQNFRIITPYDAQRQKLEQALKADKLPWEDKVFNVDSFQGNEEDTIIISCVRTQKIGFLDNKRRTNVMLSRCKKSMFLVTNRPFLTGTASSTLMGKLAEEWGDEGWLSWQDIVDGRF